jgi:hypothetical protein
LTPSFFLPNFVVNIKKLTLSKMAKLRRRVIYTDIRWEETEPLTEEQITKWKSEDEELQDEVMDEVDFDLVNDKALEDSDWPELIEE